jgi:hypothetical protein
MRAGFSFSYPPISLLLGQPLSIKKSYAGAIQSVCLSVCLFTSLCLPVLLSHRLFEVRTVLHHTETQ